MTKCPKCGKETARAAKKWEYGHFAVEAYACDKCKTKFREYKSNGKHSFMLKLQKGKGYVKV